MILRDRFASALASTVPCLLIFLFSLGIDAANLYHDFASGVRDDRPGLDSCLRALRKGDVLVDWKLDRLGRNLAHLVNTVQDLSARGRNGGRKFALSKAQVRLAQAAMAHRDTLVSELCRQLGIRPVTLYRYVGPQGQLREQGQKVLAS